MKNIILTLICCLLVFSSCRSPEFTSAMMYVNENNMEQAEEYFKQALTIEPENSLVPYYYARDILLPAERWKEMTDQFDEAVRRNPETRLEKPIVIDRKIYMTVGEGAALYREQEWGKIFNQAVDLYTAGNLIEAAEKINLAIHVFPDESKSYATLASIYLEQNNIEKAEKTATNGLKSAPKDIFLLQINGDIAQKKNDLDKAVNYYEKALNIAEDKGKILRKLIYVFIDMGDYNAAIEYSMKAIREFPSDPDIYYNVGVLYQRMAVETFEPARTKFVEESNKENWDQSALKQVYEDFNDARQYCVDAKDYFLDSADLEGDDSGSAAAVSEMKKTLNQIDNIFIPAVREMMNE